MRERETEREKKRKGERQEGNNIIRVCQGERRRITNKTKSSALTFP